MRMRTHFEARLSGFDGCDISRHSSADDDEIFLLYEGALLSLVCRYRGGLTYLLQSHILFLIGLR